MHRPEQVQMDSLRVRTLEGWAAIRTRRAPAAGIPPAPLRLHGPGTPHLLRDDRYKGLHALRASL